VRDGVYDPNAVDHQLGCAGLLIAMMALEPSIRLGQGRMAQSRVAPDPVPSSTARPSKPSLANPSKGSIGVFVLSLFAAIFKRK
jgi:hypothetical protein